MQKEFNLNSFKKASSNVSGFLKSKDVEISHITLMNALSLFLGHKNWNTLKSLLEEKKETQKDLALDDYSKSIELSLLKRLNLFMKIVETDFYKFENNYSKNYSSEIRDIQSEAHDIVKNNTLRTCIEMLSADINDEEPMKKDEEFYLYNVSLEENKSLNDETGYNIKISQKGGEFPPFLDLLFYIFSFQNKMFEDIFMGEVSLSYIYNSKIKKQVLLINVAVDNFMISEFEYVMNRFEDFIKNFYNRVIFSVKRKSESESGFGSSGNMAGNMTAHASGMLSQVSLKVKL